MDEKSIKLVELVKKHPCLYNKAVHEYGRKHYTDRSWKKISEQIGWTASECKEKWRNLRNGLVRSLKGKQEYYLHEHMEFVLQYVKFHKTKDETDKHTSYSSSTDQFEEDTKDIIDSVYSEESTCSDPIGETPDETETHIVTPKRRKMEDGAVRYLADAQKMKTSKHCDSKRLERRENCKEMFFLSLTPDVEKLTDENFMQFRINAIVDLQKMLMQQRKNTQSTKVDNEDNSP